MKQRLKKYYSIDEITNGLYTQGDELVIKGTNTDYIGWYHMYSTGEVFTQPSYDKNRSVALEVKLSGIPGEFDKSNNGIFNKLLNYKTISPYKPLPTNDDYSEGFIYRYFIKKTNDIGSNVIEISKEDYNILMNSNNLFSSLYIKYTLKWKISGNKSDVYDNGVRIDSGVYDTNKRTLHNSEIDIPGISKVLSNLLQYYK